MVHHILSEKEQSQIKWSYFEFSFYKEHTEHQD